MQLKTPFIIGARLAPALKIGDAYLTLGARTAAPGEPGRQRVTFLLDAAPSDGRRYAGEAVTVHRATGAQECFATFLSFMAAAAEAGPSSDNADMFGQPWQEFCRFHRSEIEQLICDLEQPDLLVE